MQYDLEFPVTRDLVTRATRRFWTQYVGWSGILRWSLGAGTVLVLVLLRSATSLPWLIGILVLGVIGVPVFWIAGYIVFIRRAYYRFGQMNSPIVQYRFTEESIMVRSDLGSSEVPWRILDKVQRFPEVWLLYFGRANYIYLPVEQLSDKVQSFILQQAQKHQIKTN